MKPYKMNKGSARDMGKKDDLVNFVKGMTHHDIAKPLYLGNAKHTLLGYVLLRALGKDAEALVALAHWMPKEQLKIHFAYEAQKSPGSQPLELPAYLALANALDIIASVTYSLYEDEPQVSNPSTQNPFSRLRAVATITGKPDRIGLETKVVGNLCKETFRKDFEDFITNALGADVWALLNELVDKRNHGLLEQVIEDLKQIDPEGLWRRLRSYLDRFGERTYPTPNDTSLAQHTCLSSILAYMVYANLLAKEPAFSRKRIQLDQHGDILLDSHPLADYLFSPNEDKHWPSEAQLLAAKHLGCHLIRVSFSGFEDLFSNATRLDDLIGVRELMEGKGPGEDQPSLKEAFKQAFAERLRVGELWEDIVLSEGLFDLIYLLPDCHNRAHIETHVRDANREAVARLVKERLNPLMERDFEDVPELLLEVHLEELSKQLQALPVAWACVPVKKPLLQADNDFQKWMRKFGKGMLDAYKDVQQWPSLPAEKLADTVERIRTSQEIRVEEEICEVCGSNPIFVEFNQLVPGRKVLQKVVRQKGERFEQVCLACIAIRVLSHGLIEVEALHDMVKKVDTRIEVKKPPDSPLDLPPLMRRRADLGEEEGFVDLVAAFVRETRNPRKRAEGRELDIFPTVAYAADADSNVALIALRPRDDEVFRRYQPGKMIEFGPFKLQKLFKDYYSILRQNLKPILGKLQKSTLDKEDMEIIHVHFQSLVENSIVKEILNTYDNLKKEAVAVASVKFPSLPLSGAFEELQRISNPAYREKLTDKGALASACGKLEPLLDASALKGSPLIAGNDLGEFDTFYRQPLFQIDEKMSKQVQKQARVAEPHIARVFQRIKWIQRFYSKLSDDLEAAGIRVLPIHTRYPEPLYLVPAEHLTAALHILHKSLATHLFSSHLYNFLPKDGDSPEERTRKALARLATLLFLSHILPKLLYGAVVVFKHKQPLYMVLEAARGTIEELNRLNREKGLDWSGILFGYADLRGIISERGLVQTRPPFGEMYQVIEVSQKPEIDRRSLLSAMAMLKGEEPWKVEKLPEEGKLPDIVGASLYLRGKRRGWDEETLGLLQKNRYLKPVVFLRRMAR